MSRPVVEVMRVEKLVGFAQSVKGRVAFVAATAGAVVSAGMAQAFAASPNPAVTAGFTDAGDLAVSYLTAAIPVIISVLLVGLGIGILIRVVGILRSSI